MGKRKVVILEPVTHEVARIAFFIESQGMPETAKKFVDQAFTFYKNLANEKFVHRPCSYEPWQVLNYRCATFKKKYTVAYLNNSDEIVICDFLSQKLIK
ncbi:MAG: hypothetical protein J0L66_18155 [Cytophagales bacterium]|nr:hypothetical protein [Cytophagales bacterium]